MAYRTSMEPYESLGLPSPDECIGVGGLTLSLIILTVGILAHILIADTLWTFGMIVAGLLIGWLSVMYCVVWGQALPSNNG